jgi:uncharacterized membrane protein YidH (DUF202 family)
MTRDEAIGYLLIGVGIIIAFAAAWYASGSHIRSGEYDPGQDVVDYIRSASLIVLSIFLLGQGAILIIFDQWIV